MPKETILVVDDEKEIADLVALYLQNEGFRVCKAYDAAGALDLRRTNRWIWPFWT